MEQKIFHGSFLPEELADCLIDHLNFDNLLIQKRINGEAVSIQIKTTNPINSGGNTSLGVIFKSIEGGVLVQLGQQTWAGIAASLGVSALATLMNPLNLLGRLDDIAQDLESLQITTKVWNALEASALSLGGSFEISSHLRRLECPYCGTNNLITEPSCFACGAPLGFKPLKTCFHCGFILTNLSKFCPNCKNPL